MRTIVFLVLLLLGMSTWSCDKDIYSTDVAEVNGSIPVNPQHPLADSLKAIAQRNVNKGIPGVQIMVKSPAGWYVVNAGYAKIEDKKPMQDRMVAWVYSISKTYTAALVMKMKERGKLSLDSSIQHYLPAYITNRLLQAKNITVRMLLNHTSGLKNFTASPAFFLEQFNRPLRQPSIAEQLEYLYGEKPIFEPGTDFYYSNANYLLLTLMLEQVSGKTWGELLHAEILQPLELKDTYYPVTENQVQTLGFPNYYFERFNNGVLENCTQWNHAIAYNLVGYGGIAANGRDVIRFMEALVEGKVVSQESLQEMRSWIKGKESTEAEYGLGLEYFEYEKGVPTYGHEGDNLGATTEVLYIPSKQTYIFISINAGRVFFGKYLFRTTDFKRELCGFVSRF